MGSGLPPPPGPSFQPPGTGPLSPPRPGASHRLPPGPQPRLPPPSPTHHRLTPPEEVMDQMGDWIVPGRVGHVAIRLAKECVFGADVMAKGKLSEEQSLLG